MRAVPHSIEKQREPRTTPRERLPPIVVRFTLGFAVAVFTEAMVCVPILIA